MNETRNKEFEEFILPLMQKGTELIKKIRRLFCFSDLFIKIKEKKGYFYICGSKDIVSKFEVGLSNKIKVLSGVEVKGKKA